MISKLRLLVLCVILVSAAFLALEKHVFPPVYSGGRLKLLDCENRMRKISQALHAYVRIHRDFPRGIDGRFTPDSLLCRMANESEGCLQNEDASCTLQANSDGAWGGFVWCREPSIDQVKAFLGEPGGAPDRTWIVLAHDVTNFHHTTDDYMPVLLSNGDLLRNQFVNHNEYRTWLRTKFLKGDSTRPQFMR